MSKLDYNYKKIFFKLKGQGDPLLLLHGNTASSRMFRPVMGFLARHFRLILVDYPGHGRSDRIKDFPLDYWYANGLMVANLLDHLKLKQVNIIGCSGGALVGLNIALERPDLVRRLIADSFEGDHSRNSYVNSLAAQRYLARKKIGARLFWFYNHGHDWRRIVDQDTRMMLDFHSRIGSFFHRDIAELHAPVLLTGSRKDEFLPDIAGIYAELAGHIGSTAAIRLFDDGHHPAMLSNARAFSSTALDFFSQPEQA